MRVPFSLMRQFLGLALAAALLPAAAAADAQQVTVYSARKEGLIQPLLDDFSRRSGIGVNLVTGAEDQLMDWLKGEGPSGPADLLLTTDVGRLHRAQAEGLLQPVESAVLTQNIPARYRDPAGYWFGLSKRARVLFYAKGRVKPAELSTYEGLIARKWRQRICVRSAGSVYNQSLLSSMILSSGDQKALEWAIGIVDNMARPPAGGDREQLMAVASGQCDIAIANTYYFAALQTSDRPEERHAAEKVGLFWPNQQGRGAHVNISGAGVVAASRARSKAVALLEYLSGPEAQRLYAELNHEYPVTPGIKASALVAAWGPFKAEDLDVARIGENTPEAQLILEQANWR